MPGRDTRTRYQSVYARHRQDCGVGRLPRKPTLKEIAKACTCTPSFYGVVYDPESGRTLKTKHLRALASARDARHDLKGRVAAGVVVAAAGITLGDLLDQFVIAAKGVALNKRGRPYKRSAYTDIESALKHVPESLRRKPAEKVRRGDLQHQVDTLRMSTTKRGTQIDFEAKALVAAEDEDARKPEARGASSRSSRL